MTIDKAVLRADMHERRSQIGAEERAKAAIELAGRLPDLANAMPIGASVCVSTFWPIGPELATVHLEAALVERGCALCLPVMTGRNKPLLFRRYANGDSLVDRMWGIKEPPADAPAVTPDVLLVPLLAVDDEGWRLGYGGGFYDRTLRQLRASGNPIAVGVGYDFQLVAAVPHEDYDQPVDWVLTPSGLHKCRAQAA